MSTKKSLNKEIEALKAQITALHTELALVNHELDATKRELEAERAKHTSPYVYTDHCAQLWMEEERKTKQLEKEVAALKADNRKLTKGLMEVRDYFNSKKYYNEEV